MNIFNGPSKIKDTHKDRRIVMQSTRKHFNFESEEDRLEIERLIACYQTASRDDKNVVWAALNKYAPKIDKIAP